MAQVSCQVPSADIVAGWDPRPAPFSTTKRSLSVQLLEDKSVAEIDRGTEGQHDYGVVYTEHTLTPGQVWQMEMLTPGGVTPGPMYVVSGCVLTVSVLHFL